LKSRRNRILQRYVEF